MKNFLGILIVELMFASQVFAQHSVQGTVVDKANNERMDMVSVRLVKVQQTDTVLVSGALTDEKGFFILQKVQDDSYTLIFNYLGYKEKSLPIVVDGKAVNVGTVALTASVTELGQVEVRGTAAEMTVKGDTLEYNAGAYQTPENAMVEDLLRKMPGVEVSSDGTVTINGEQVKGVRVDGKKFFGSDVQTATKNIPADMIDKVQVIDQQSDMARLTGFEDDETERIINLTLKKQKKKGLFGNFTGGVGADLVNKDNKFMGYDKYFFRDDFFKRGKFLSRDEQNSLRRLRVRNFFHCRRRNFFKRRKFFHTLNQSHRPSVRQKFPRKKSEFDLRGRHLFTQAQTLRDEKFQLVAEFFLRQFADEFQLCI